MVDDAELDPRERDGVQAIRNLCQGLPLLAVGPKVEVPQETLELFEVEDTEDFIRLVQKALGLMVTGSYKDALKVALGDLYADDTLTQRRNHWCEATGVSYRTLIRHEQEGAKRLAHLMMNISGQESVTTSRETTDELLERVRNLEITVRALTALSQTLIQQSSGRGKLDGDALRVALNGGKRGDLLAEDIFRRASIGVKVRADTFEETLREQAEEED